MNDRTAEIAQLMDQFRHHPQDSGSMEVQIVALTRDIENVTRHLEKNSHDYSSQRGLMKMVARRKAYLEYLKRHDQGRYRQLIDAVGLRK